MVGNKWYRRYTHVDDAELGDLSRLGFIEGVDFGVQGPHDAESYLTMAWYESQQGGTYHRLEAERAGWGVLANSHLQALLTEAGELELTPGRFCELLERQGFSEGR